MQNKWHFIRYSWIQQLYEILQEYRLLHAKLEIIL